MAEIHWASQVDGSFNDSADWTGDVVPGAGDNAILDASGNTDYTVTAASGGTVDSIQTAKTATFSITANDFTATDGAGSGANAGAIVVGNGAAFSAAGTFDNTGAIALSSTGGQTSLIVGSAGLSLTGAGQVTLTNSTANYIFGAARSDVLTNVDDTISGAGHVGNGDLTLINQAKGVIDATGTSAVMTIDTYGETLANAGLIESTGAAGLTIQSTTLANTGTLKDTGAGALTLYGSTVADSGAGQVSTTKNEEIDLKTATITGAAMTVVSGATITSLQGANALAITTMTNQSQILIDEASSLELAGTFDNTGAIALSSTGGQTSLIVGSAGLSLTGAGQVTLTNSTANYIFGAARSDVLTNVDDTISGAGHVGNGDLTLINQAKGVIDATGTSAVMTIDTYGETLANAGLIESTGAAGLTIQSTTLANTGTLKDTGAGALTLYGSTVADSGAGQVSTTKNEEIDLKTATITGAAMTVVSGATITSLQGANALAITTMTNQSQILIDEASSLELAGTFDNTGAIALSSTGGQTSLIVGSAGLSLTGAGQVTLTNSTANYIFGAARSDVLTNVDDTISGAGHVGNGDLTLINQAKGVIDATGTSAVMTIDTYGETLANAGLIESTGAAGLTIQGTTLANTGTLKDTGAGALTLYGSTVADSGAGQVSTTKNEEIDLKTATITGAAMTVVSGATITSLQGANALAITTMTNQSQILIDEASSLELAGTFDNTGAIALSSTGGQTSLIVGSAGLSLTGAGQVTLTNSTANYIFGAARSDVLTNVDDTISGAGHVGNGDLTLINQAKGVIDATGTSAVMTIDTYGETLANAGLIESTGAAGLTIQSTTLANTGTLEAVGSGVFTLFAVTVVNEATGKIVVAKDAQLSFADDGALSNLTGTTLTGGTYTVDAGGTLQLADNVSVAELDAVVALDGAGSEIQSLDTTTSSEVTLEATLTGIGATGALEVLGGRNYTSANAVANSGTIELGGGTLNTGVLTDAARSALTGFGVVASVFSDSGVVTSSGGTLAFKAKGDSFAGVLAGGEIDFTGGTDLLGKGASLTVSTIGLSGAAVVTLGADQSFSGTWNQGAASADLAGFTLALSGASIFTGAAVNGDGTLSFAGGAQTLGTGTNLGAANWSLSGGAVTSLGEDLAYAGTLTQATGTTLALGAHTLTLTGSGSTLAGSVTGTGTLAFAGGNQALNTGASLGVTHWSLSGAAAAAVDENLTYAGAFSEGSGASVTVAAGDTLTLTQSPKLAGAVGGVGTLAIGGAVTLSSGLTLGVAGLSLLSGATVTLGGARSYAGKLSQAAASTLALGANTLSLTGSGSTLAGSVTGTGTLAFAGGSQSLISGASLGVSHWSLSDGAAAALDENLSYGGAFTEGSGTSLAVASGDTLTLSGASTISGAVNGAGALALAGGTEALDAGAVLGVASWSLAGGASAAVNENLIFGGAFSQAAGTTLSVASGDTLTLNKAPSLAGAVDGAGTLAIGGAVTLGTGLTLGVAGLSLLSGATATLGGARSYAGALTQANGSTLAIGANTLTLSGGVSSLAGALTGSGSLALTGGTTDFDTGATLSVSKISQSGGSTVADVEATTLDYAGSWTQTSGTLAVATGDRVNFTGTGNSFSGILSGAGTIAFIGGGSDTLTGAHLTGASIIVSGPTVTLGGATLLSGTLVASTDSLIIAAGGASLGGDGSLILSNLSTNAVHGGTLTNINDFIKGAGLLGDGAMILVNDHGGIIDGDDSVALTIDTGASVITNAGTIEATSKGTTTVSSAVDNTGALAALGGNLTVDAAVTGTGNAEIDGGTADFAGSFSQNVAFLGAGGGTLELAHSQTYAGEISGFSRTGTTTLDLEDIAFISGTTTATYSGAATSGVLTVTDGTHIARITLEGNYLSSKFTVSSDGHGGTSIGDPAAVASTHRFVAAMAGFGSSAGFSHSAPDASKLALEATLVRPGMAHT